MAQHPVDLRFVVLGSEPVCASCLNALRTTIPKTGIMKVASDVLQEAGVIVEPEVLQALVVVEQTLPSGGALTGYETRYETTKARFVGALAARVDVPVEPSPILHDDISASAVISRIYEMCQDHDHQRDRGNSGLGCRYCAGMRNAVNAIDNARRERK